MPVGHRPKGKGGGQFVAGGGTGRSGKDKGKGAAAGDAGKADRIARARASKVKVAAEVQQYAEGNETVLAKALGGESFATNLPADVILSEGGVIKHGIELKTVTALNTNAKITMKGDAVARKRSWARKNKATFHTVVFDDSKVFNALGAGQHDESKRRILYRRGCGAFRLQNMHVCEGIEELKTLLEMPSKKLPPGAK